MANSQEVPTQIGSWIKVVFYYRFPVGLKPGTRIGDGVESHYPGGALDSVRFTHRIRRDLGCEGPGNHCLRSGDETRSAIFHLGAEDLQQFVAQVKTVQVGGDRRKHPDVMAIYVDPSAASFKLECSRMGLPIRDADNSVLDGIRFQATMLNNGQYFIHRRCAHTIDEYSGYVWDPKKQLLGIDAPIKTGDHAKDAERYALYTHFGGDQLIYTSAALKR